MKKERLRASDGPATGQLFTVNRAVTSEDLSLSCLWITAEMIDARTRWPIPGQYVRTKNVLLDIAKGDLLLHVFNQSSRSIQRIAVGSGTTAPDQTDTSLQTLVTSKAIASYNTAGVSSIPPSLIATTTFEESEANGAGTSFIRELGFLFDNSDPVSRTLFAQGTITGATQAEPVVITSAGVQAALVAAGGGNGSQVYIESVGGMTDLNGNHYFVGSLATNSFELFSDQALTTPVDGAGFGAYTSGGKWTLTLEKNNTRVMRINYAFSLGA